MDNNYNENYNQNYQQGNEGTGQQNQQNDQGSLYSYTYTNHERREEPNRQYYTPYDEPQKKKREKKPRKKGFGVTMAKCVALALVFGLVGGTVSYGTGFAVKKITGESSQTAAVQATGTDNNVKVTTTSSTKTTVVSDVSGVVDDVMPSIVSITNTTVQQYNTFWGTLSQETPSAGSGIIVAQDDENLYIATNNHVVADSTDLTVCFVDDTTVAAEIKGTDASYDLAVVSVNISDIPADTLSAIKVATLGDSDSLKVGEPAIAIGNAMGYGQSVTTGVISALDREVSVEDNDGNVVTNNLVQTDAAINPGNSGGALLNINGEVIGINSVKYSDTDVEGMGFAIPISTAEPIINDLITREVVSESDSAYLGIQGVDVTDEVASSYNMPKGIYVNQVVSGSAAEQAGIQKGDIITSFDGREVDTMENLADRMQYYAAGTTVEITLQSADNGTYVERTISVTLGKKN
jgi:serine protease Do